MIKCSESTGMEHYFNEIQGVLAQLTTTNVNILDKDVVQIVVKVKPDSYDTFLQHFTAYSKYPPLSELQVVLQLEES